MIKIIMSERTAATLVANCDKSIKIMQNLLIDKKISSQDYQTVLDALCTAKVYTNTSMEFKDEPATVL